MTSYEESKQEVEKFMRQGQNEFVSLKELIEKLTERVDKLEEENSRLRWTVKNLYYNSNGGELPVLGVEIVFALENWANGEERDE